MQFKTSVHIIITLLSVSILSCAAKSKTSNEIKPSSDMKKTYSPDEIRQNGWETATFGGGCFWCTEAIFEEVIGVKSVVSGYAGGHTKNPTYQSVITDTTGHAECVQVVYNPAECTFETLLNIHFKTHDPTTLNRQGNDEGIQYRSVVFYANDMQKITTENYIRALSEEKYYNDPIVTEVVPLNMFYPAETYHQDYFAKNPDQSYCVYVVAKKVEKFEKLFPELVKHEYK